MARVLSPSERRGQRTRRRQTIRGSEYEQGQKLGREMARSRRLEWSSPRRGQNVHATLAEELGELVPDSHFPGLTLTVRTSRVLGLDLARDCMPVAPLVVLDECLRVQRIGACKSGFPKSQMLRITR